MPADGDAARADARARARSAVRAAGARAASVKATHAAALLRRAPEERGDRRARVKGLDATVPAQRAGGGARPARRERVAMVPRYGLGRTARVPAPHRVGASKERRGAVRETLEDAALRRKRKEAEARRRATAIATADADRGSGGGDGGGADGALSAPLEFDWSLRPRTQPDAGVAVVGAPAIGKGLMDASARRAFQEEAAAVALAAATGGRSPTPPASPARRAPGGEEREGRSTSQDERSSPVRAIGGAVNVAAAAARGDTETSAATESAVQAAASSGGSGDGGGVTVDAGAPRRREALAAFQSLGRKVMAAGALSFARPTGANPAHLSWELVHELRSELGAAREELERMRGALADAEEAADAATKLANDKSNESAAASERATRADAEAASHAHALVAAEARRDADRLEAAAEVEALKRTLHAQVESADAARAELETATNELLPLRQEHSALETAFEYLRKEKVAMETERATRMSALIDKEAQCALGDASFAHTALDPIFTTGALASPMFAERRAQWGRRLGFDAHGDGSAKGAAMAPAVEGAPSRAPTLGAAELRRAIASALTARVTAAVSRHPKVSLGDRRQVRRAMAMVLQDVMLPAIERRLEAQRDGSATTASANVYDAMPASHVAAASPRQGHKERREKFHERRRRMGGAQSASAAGAADASTDAGLVESGGADACEGNDEYQGDCDVEAGSDAGAATESDAPASEAATSVASWSASEANSWDGDVAEWRWDGAAQSRRSRLSSTHSGGLGNAPANLRSRPLTGAAPGAAYDAPSLAGGSAPSPGAPTAAVALNVGRGGQDGSPYGGSYGASSAYADSYPDSYPDSYADGASDAAFSTGSDPNAPDFRQRRSPLRRGTLRVTVAAGAGSPTADAARSALLRPLSDKQSSSPVKGSPARSAASLARSDIPAALADDYNGDYDGEYQGDYDADYDAAGDGFEDSYPDATPSPQR